MRILASILITAAAFGLSSCQLDYVIQPPVTCQALLSLHVGDQESQVINVLGPPGFSLARQATLVDGTPVDRYLSYNPGKSPSDTGFRRWDHFEVYLRQGRVVEVSATRQNGNSRVQQLAFRLKEGPAGGDPGDRA